MNRKGTRGPKAGADRHAVARVKPSGSLAAWGADLMGAFFAGRKPTTVDAYRRDLADLARFLGVPHADIPRALLGQGHGAANLAAFRYRADLLARGLSPATVNRRLAAVASLVKMARTMGRVSFSLDVPRVKASAYRDTRGPGEEAVDLILNELTRRETSSNVKARRDRALVLLMFDLALRRGEAAALDLDHVDLAGGAVSIMGKGRHERETRTLTAPAADALAAWIGTRGDQAGPLFLGVNRAGGLGGRLTGRGIHKIMAALGTAAGVGTVRPHGFRHAAITAALDAGQGVREVMRFSRHLDPRTVMKYDDNRRDVAGEVSRLLASRRAARLAAHAERVKG